MWSIFHFQEHSLTGDHICTCYELKEVHIFQGGEGQILMRIIFTKGTCNPDLFVLSVE